MPSLNTLISDIDTVIQTGEPKVSPEVLEDALVEFGIACGKVAEGLVQPKPKDIETPYLRPSNIGLPDRKLWYVLNSEPRSPGDIDPAQTRSFAFGNIIEALIIFLARVAGHEVTDLQKEVDVAGVKGNMDFRLDGIVTDAKSVSPWVWDKWKTGALLTDPEADAYGYKEQLNVYSNGETEAAWVAMNKSNGELALLVMDMFNGKVKDSTALVERKQKIKDLKEPPREKCYKPQAYGKGGNEALAKGCTMCAFKKPCWDGEGVRVFKYSTGPVYLTKVVKTPDVEELPW